MSEMITSQAELPAAAFYVTARDTVMSGWGRSKGRDNLVILPCETFAEAEGVSAYARSRSDMADVRILLVTRGVLLVFGEQSVEPTVMQQRSNIDDMNFLLDNLFEHGKILANASEMAHEEETWT